MGKSYIKVSWIYQSEIFNSQLWLTFFFLHRAYPGCILLWLHSHTTSRWLVSIPLWWKGCVWLWSPFDISGSTVYSSCCLSQCCNFNVGESGGRSWTGSEIHWSLYQPKWIASLLLTMIFLTTQLSSASGINRI